VGEKTWDSSLKALRPLGRLVTCGATTGPHVTLDIRRLFWFQWSLLGSTMGSDREFRDIVALGERGRLRPVIDSVIPLAEGVRAFERLQAGEQLGKLVIEVTQ
jgi:zinc-binding alcohol dehydrogenase/oxidoreductase